MKPNSNHYKTVNSWPVLQNRVASVERLCYDARTRSDSFEAVTVKKAKEIAQKNDNKGLVCWLHYGLKLLLHSGLATPDDLRLLAEIDRAVCPRMKAA